MLNTGTVPTKNRTPVWNVRHLLLPLGKLGTQKSGIGKLGTHLNSIGNCYTINHYGTLRYLFPCFHMFPGVILNVLQETTHGPPPDRIFQFCKIYVWVPQKTPMSHGTCPLKIPSKSHRLMMADAYHVLMLFKDIMISDPRIFQIKKTWRTSGGSQ